MDAKKDICVVCAWRETCQKKFSVSGKGLHCPDFTRDITLPEAKEESPEETDFTKKEED